MKKEFDDWIDSKEGRQKILLKVSKIMHSKKGKIKPKLKLIKGKKE